MSEDYKRAVCNFCPSRPDCERLRGKLWCGKCEIALVCTMTEDVGVTDCHVAVSHWRDALPGKCLLAERALGTFARASESQHGAQEGADGFVRNKRSAIFCPRCMHATMETQTKHSWAPLFGGGGFGSVFSGNCEVCGLDVEITLE